jgi:hypothetical protein
MANALKIALLSYMILYGLLSLLLLLFVNSFQNFVFRGLFSYAVANRKDN